ncbi:hypothetical protein K9M79_03620 [Candidatus Woesearchaeota archaeon]|nr:hypothetical protein [Candidatus Woesearchaeota archaeon]
MLRHAKDMIGFELDAIDEQFGKVKDFFFDDVIWAVRYLVADTQKWLPGREVLISPTSLDRADEHNEKLRVELTKDKIKDSPPILSDRPVSRQDEIILTKYFGWTNWWENLTKEVKGDPNLRSIKEVISYGVNSLDGQVGKIIDIVIDDADWTVRYMIVESEGKKVLLALDWITEINEKENKILVNLMSDTVRDAPVYDPERPINRIIETEVFDHYQKKYYW